MLVENRTLLLACVLVASAVCLTVATAFAAPPVAQDDIIDGDSGLPMAFRDELAVPTGIIDGNDNYDTARLADGNFVVVWTPGGTADESVYFRMFSASGRPLTEVRTANQASDGVRVLQPAIAALADGGFVIAWKSEIYIRYRVYDADGEPTGLSRAFLQPPDLSFPHELTGLPDGSFVLFWHVRIGDGMRIGAQRIRPDGTLIGGVYTVAGDALEIAILDYLFPTPDGGYVAIWAFYPVASLVRVQVPNLAFQAYSATNQRVGNMRTLRPDDEFDQHLAAGAAIPDGHFMIAFRQEQRAATDIFVAQIFGTDAQPVTDQFEIDAEDDEGIAGDAAIGGRPDSLFRVTLSSRPLNFFDRPTLTQLYDQTGAPVGERFQADADARQYEGNIHDISTTGDQFSLIFARRYQSASEPRRNDIIVRAFAHPTLFDEALNPVDPLGNDSDADGDSLSVTAINGQPISEGQSIDLASGARISMSNGTLFHDSRGATDFDSASRTQWRSDSFEYTVSAGGETVSATATVFLEGINDPPQAITDRFDIDETANASFLTIDVLANDQDIDIADQGRLVLTSVLNNDSGGVAVLSGDGLQIEYRPLGRYEALAPGERATDRVDYIVTDPGGLTATGRINVLINGENDLPVIEPEAVHLSALAGEVDLSDRILAFASDIDNGDSVLLSGAANCAGGTAGNVRFANGRIFYNADGAFGTIRQGEAVDDCIAVTVTDSYGGMQTDEVPLRINGNTNVQLTVRTAGLGNGRIIGNRLVCAEPGGCSLEFPAGTAISLTATADAGSTLANWSAPCTATSSCQFDLLADTTVIAAFDQLAPAQANIVGAILPAARTGEHAGAPVTAFMSVVAGASGGVQNCRIQLLQDVPFDLSYRRLDGTSPVGPDSPVFGLAAREVASFVLAFQPTGDPGEQSVTIYPAVTCDNASMRSTDGVNSIRLYTERAVWMDLLAIAATPSQDGVLRINSPGGAGFMAASFINITSGTIDGPSPQVLISADTGDVELPVDLTWCITGADGICTTERTNQPLAHYTSNNLAHFVAVFARAHSDQGIPFDPANARVYLRFVGVLANIERAVTSVAITAPSTASTSPAEIAGSWSLLRPSADNGRPEFERIRLELQPSGDGLLFAGGTGRPVRMNRLRLAGNGHDWLFELDGQEGVITRDGRIRLGNPVIAGDGSWGIRMANQNRQGGADDLSAE